MLTASAVDTGRRCAAFFDSISFNDLCGRVQPA